MEQITQANATAANLFTNFTPINTMVPEMIKEERGFYSCVSCLFSIISNKQNLKYVQVLHEKQVTYQQQICLPNNC